MTFKSLRCSILLLLALTAGLFVAEYGASFSEPLQTAPGQELRPSAVNVLNGDADETSSGETREPALDPGCGFEFVSLLLPVAQETEEAAAAAAPESQPESQEESNEGTLPAPQSSPENPESPESEANPSTASDDRTDPTSLTPELEEALQMNAEQGVDPIIVRAPIVFPEFPVLPPLPALPSMQLKGMILGADGGATVFLEIEGSTTQLTVSSEQNQVPLEIIRSEVVEFKASKFSSEIRSSAASQQESWELVHASRSKVVLRSMPWRRLIELH